MQMIDFLIKLRISASRFPIKTYFSSSHFIFDWLLGLKFFQIEFLQILDILVGMIYSHSKNAWIDFLIKLSISGFQITIYRLDSHQLLASLNSCLDYCSYL